MNKHVPVAHALEELKRIDESLKQPVLLIGGLAVHHYYRPRTSEDIDIVCPVEIATAILKSLYKTVDYIIVDKNNEILRPAWEITHRKTGRKTFIGPKISEREPYQFVDYDFLAIGAEPYIFKGESSLENILVPPLEAMALMKLLSLASRLPEKPEKGQQDLDDFVNLTNLPKFMINKFIDIIADDCKEHLTTQLAQFVHFREGPIFGDSSLWEVCQLLFPPSKPKPIATDSVVSVYSPENALQFYEIVADNYDSRNTKFLHRAHQAVIGEIQKLLTGDATGVVDLGCGTGRQIAVSFARQDVKWIAIDGCSRMLELFQQNIDFDGSRMNAILIKDDLKTIDFATLTAQTGEDDKFVAVLSFVLTSMTNEEILTQLTSVVPAVEAVIIADIHPLYTATHPNYDFKLQEKGVFNLTPRAVYPDILQSTLTAAGFNLVSPQLVRRQPNGDAYAFVYTFRRTTGTNTPLPPESSSDSVD